MSNFKVTATKDKEKLLAALLPEDFSYDVKIVSDYKKFNTEYDFAVFKDGNGLVFDCPVYSFAREAILRYLASEDVGKEVKYKSVWLKYSDFGAAMDGVQDDYDAIRRTHEAANIEPRHKVRADDSAKYYVKKLSGGAATIMTDTYFGNAEIIIDDREVDNTDATRAERGAHLFLVANDYNVTYTLDDDPLEIIKRINENGGVHRDTKTLPLNLGYDALIMPIIESRKIYRRWGHSGRTGPGSPQTEVVFVNANNEISEETPLLFDYPAIEKINIFRADPAPITICGGLFRQIATRADMPWAYVNRGFWIQRSNVTFDGLVHYVENQPLGSATRTDENGQPIYNDGGPNYNGFLFPHHSNNLLVKNVKLSGRVHYRQGSYDVGGAYANKIIFKNCSQYNMFEEEDKMFRETGGYWGIQGTNGCKNVEYIDCDLSRFDAHAGVVNFKISGCRIGIINAVGGGTALIENSTIYNARVIGLREDYAASWEGEIIVRNCKLINKEKKLAVVTGAIHNAEMGLDTVMPNITVENLTHNHKDDIEAFELFGMRCDDSFFEENAEIKNNIHVNNTVKIKQPKGYEFTKISRNEYEKQPLYKEVVIE